MRNLITNYSFNPTAQTITFNSYSSIVLENILLIIDATNNQTIYQTNDPTKSGTVSGNILTLTYNTNNVSFNSTDRLQIFYETASPFSNRIVSASFSSSFQSLVIPCGDLSGVGISVSGSWTGSLSTDSSIDGNYFTSCSTYLQNGEYISLIITSSGIYQGNANGLQYFRINSLGLISGSCNVTMVATSNANTIEDLSINIQDGYGNQISSTSGSLNVQITGLGQKSSSNSLSITPAQDSQFNIGYASTINQISGSSGYLLTTVGQYNAVQVTPGGKYVFSISNPNFTPLASYSLNFEESVDSNSWNPIQVTPKTLQYNNIPTSSVTHINTTIANVPIVNNALTTINTHSFQIGQQIFFGTATATAGAYITGVYGPMITTCSIVTGIFTCNNNFYVGQPVYFENISATGFASNTYYYVSSASPTQFTLSSTVGGATIIPTTFAYAMLSSGIFCGNPYYITSVPSSTSFTLGTTPTNTLLLTGCPVLGAGSVNNVSTISAGPTANALTTSNNHNFVVGQPFVFGTQGSLTGVVSQSMYYINSVPTPTTFTLATASGGPTITLGGTFTGATALLASPASASSVVANGTITTAQAHGFSVNQPIVFSNPGNLSGLSANTVYYVNTIPTSTTFTISNTVGGSTISTLGTVLGTVSLYSTGITVSNLGVGLYIYQVPSNINYLRCRLTSINGNVNVYAFIDNYSRPSNTINIPFTGGTNIPSGTPTIPILETSNLTNIVHDVNILAGTSQNIYAYQTSDPGFNYFDIQTLDFCTSTFVTGTNFNTVGTYKYYPQLRYFKSIILYASNLTYNCTGVVSNTGITLPDIQPVVVGNTVSITANSSVNIGQLAATTPATISATSANKGLVVSPGLIGGAALVASTAYSSNTPTGKTLTTSDGGTALDLMVSVTTAPTTAGYLNLIVQDTLDGGTSYEDIYHCEPILIANSAGKYIIRDIPLLSGKPQLVVTTNAVSAITATINGIYKPISNGFSKQFFDQSAIIPSYFNSKPTPFIYGTSNTSAGSTLAPTWNFSGCKSLTLTVKSSYYNEVTIPPVYGILFSINGTDFWDSGFSLPVTSGNNTFGGCLINQGPINYAVPYIKTAGVGIAPQISGFVTSIITTSTPHNLQLNQIVVFTNVGSLTGVTANTYYYVTAVQSAYNFSISSYYGGTAITLGGSVGTAAISPITQFYAILKGQA